MQKGLEISAPRWEPVKVERTELLDQCRPFVPRLQELVRSRNEVLARHGADRNVRDFRGLEPCLRQERLQLIPNRLEAGLGPADLRREVVNVESARLS